MRFDADLVADAVVQPPLAELRARARRRSRRRRVFASGVSAAVLVLAGLVIPPRPSGSPTPSGDFFTDMVVIDRTTAVSVRWNDCALVMSVTTDAGATWTPYRGPMPWQDCGIPIGPRFQAVSARLFVTEFDNVRYVTTDAGATWQSGEPILSVVDSLPPRAAPLDQTAFVDPDTGEFFQLPDIRNALSTRAAPDGTLWMLASPSPNRPVDADVPVEVLRSVDRGRTWPATSPLPAMTADGLLVPVSAAEAYLVTREAGRPVVHHTVDGGASWSTEHPPWSRPAAAAVGDGGALIVVADGSSAWASTDGGVSFAGPVPAPVQGARAARGADSLLWVVADDGSVRLTTDGRSWQRIPARP